MSAASPTITVIIPTYNSNATLAFCLEALAAQDYPASDFEVIVVDNASSPPVRATREFDFSLRIVVETRPGSYAARNRGIALARGELIAFTDADCIPDPGWLSVAAAHMRDHPSTDLVGGRIDLTFATPGAPTLVELYDVVTDAFPQRRYIERNHFAVTANLIVRKAVFERVGPFDASLRSGGDGQWTRRAHDKGCVLEYCDAAVVRHPARSSVAEIARQRRRIAGGHAMLRRDALFRTRLAYAKVMAPFRIWRRVGAKHDIAMQRRLGLSLIVAWISINEIAEILLLSLGKRPARR